MSITYGGFVMAKLTRTQKYAELRETLANDPESSLSTKELSDYENRLNNITNQLENEVKQVQEVAQGIAKEAKEVVSNEVPEEYKWVDFEDVTAPIEQLVESFKVEQNNNVQENVTENNVEINAQETVTYQQPVVEPVYEQPVVEHIQQEEPVEERNINDVMQEINPFEDDFKPVEPEVKEFVPDTNYHNVEVSPIGDKEQVTYESGPPIAEFEKEEPEMMGLYVNPEIEKAYRENEERLQEEALNNQEPQLNTVEQQIHKGIVSESDFEKQVIEDTRVKEDETKKVYEPIVEVEEPEKPQSTILEEPADNHALDHEDDHTNTFISDVMNEVSAHNQQTGSKTINQLTNDIVSEVRHSDKPVEQKPVVNKEIIKEDDEEFSNTVSTEISRIMDEYEASTPAPQPVQQPKVATPANTPVSEVELKQEVKPKPTPQPVKEVKEEHPVLTKALEDEKAEDVVEIKNIDDTDLSAPAMKDATTGTIPFVVAASDDELVDDEFEEDGSNTILNIILIILIVILLAVLGLIIFYILKTRGII